MKYFLILMLFLISVKWSATDHDTKIRGFASIDFTPPEDNSSFFVGQYDNFVTSQITDRISFLVEVVLKNERTSYCCATDAIFN